MSRVAVVTETLYPWKTRWVTASLGLSLGRLGLPERIVREETKLH